jgi:hypothetical protein
MINENTTPMASEAGHYYDMVTGEPRYTVIGENGKERATRITDAMKHNWAPSVTMLTAILASPGLNRYFERQTFDAVMRQWRAYGTLDDASDDLLYSKIHRNSREHSKAAADRGTELHGAIERFIRGEDPGDEWRGHVEALVATLHQYGISLTCGEPEKSFAHEMGFGGKVDYHERGDAGLICDFKSKPTITPGKRYGYDNHAMQLAAYSMGLGMPYARGLNVFVGVEDRKILIHEWSDTDLTRGWCMFSLCLKLWQLTKSYYPTKEKAP